MPNNFKDSFKNSIIGMAVADNPAIMLASGWNNKNGNWTQKPNKSSQRLANNLSVVSTLSPTHPLNAAIRGGVQTAKAVKGILPRTTRRATIANIDDLMPHKIGEGAEAVVINNSPFTVGKITEAGSGELLARNKIPNAAPIKFIGYTRSGTNRFPTFVQRKMKILSQEQFPKYIQKLDKSMLKNGFKRIYDPKVQYRAYTNGKVVIDDISPDNIGLNWRKQPRMIDFNLSTIPDWLDEGFTMNTKGF